MYGSKEIDQLRVLTLFVLDGAERELSQLAGGGVGEAVFDEETIALAGRFNMLGGLYERFADDIGSARFSERALASGNGEALAAALAIAGRIG